LFISAGKKKVSRGVLSAGGQRGQGTAQQQQQQGNTAETLRQSYLSSGKFGLTYFLVAYLSTSRSVMAERPRELGDFKVVGRFERTFQTEGSIAHQPLLASEN